MSSVYSWEMKDEDEAGRGNILGSDGASRQRFAVSKYIAAPIK